MKNIHILPTDKPSRLIQAENDELMLLHELFENNYNINKHIYITSDEEIKEGDWVLFTINDVIEIIKVTTVINNAFDSKEGFGYGLENCKKIIITTDQDLIKDGVQEIDDEFLEWFVNNPSCEEVKVEKFHGINTSIAEINAISGDNSSNWQGSSDLRDYKIIIPKEEPKQESLEEASKYYAHNYFDMHQTNNYKALKQGFEAGAKWQQERMYSEEDLKEAFFNGIKVTGEGYNAEFAMGNDPNVESVFDEDYNKWFEQFKKK